MPFDNLPAVITLLIALSVATERFTEIIKGIWPWLNEHKDDKRKEARRNATLQVLAVVGGVAISWLASPISGGVLEGEGGPLRILGLGLLASGGSGFWNSMLGYVTSIKNLKREEATQFQEAARGMPGRFPEPAEGELAP